MKSNFLIPEGGGVHHPEPHHPEPKCHVDLRSNYFIPGVGGTSAGRLVNFDSFSEIGYRTP